MLATLVSISRLVRRVWLLVLVAIFFCCLGSFFNPSRIMVTPNWVLASISFSVFDVAIPPRWAPSCKAQSRLLTFCLTGLSIRIRSYLFRTKVCSELCSKYLFLASRFGTCTQLFIQRKTENCCGRDEIHPLFIPNSSKPSDCLSFTAESAAD